MWVSRESAKGHSLCRLPGRYGNSGAPLLVGQISGSVRIHNQSAKIRPHESLESRKDVFHQRLMKSSAISQGACQSNASQRACRRRKRMAM